MSTPLLRCAIYTRKSTEAGLEQDFNSLDAQREACLAYIKSQKHEGWSAIAQEYDDGGFSGGSMERPALQRLMADIAAGKVNIIVVYKVDRLTRSLADFAKIIEVLDGHKASFVSVTQQFNTTSSMGRLTLNVLLSFAQFEREVTSERIRDKIAASKKKGLWMGGITPLGYDVGDKKLVVNAAEAKCVLDLFNAYLDLGTVRKLKEYADRVGYRGKSWTTRSGRKVEGGPMSRGALYHLLQSAHYIGRIVHRDQDYPGTHKAIVPIETWTLVQARLKEQWGERHTAQNRKSPCWLIGLMFDAEGRRFTSVKTTKDGRQYHYYITGSKEETQSRLGWRLPAKQIEVAVIKTLLNELRDPARLVGLIVAKATHGLSVSKINEVASHVEALARDIGKLTNVFKNVAVRDGELELKVCVPKLCAVLELPTPGDDATHTIIAPIELRRRGIETRLVVRSQNKSPTNFDPKLMRWVAKAHVWFEQLKSGERTSIEAISQAEKIDGADISRALPLAFLAPTIVEAIINGGQNPKSTAESVRRLTWMPKDWREQAVTM